MMYKPHKSSSKDDQTTYFMIKARNKMARVPRRLVTDGELGDGFQIWAKGKSVGVFWCE